uniref:BTB domain containing 2 n=1 Tax=Gallus gallus TaxID=9031 RepID=A0A8V1A666_CHICK
MAAGGSGPGGLSSSCPQPPPPPPGNGAACAAADGTPASPPGLTYNQCGANNPAAAAGGAGGGGGGPGVGAAPAGGPGGGLQREPVYNWQATKPTVQERFAFLFNNEVLSDVHFLVGKGRGTQRIPAHRFVLAVGSAVFDAMFNGGMATTSTEIELPDVEPAAFLALLKFLYSDEVQIGPETVMTTLYTAKKYAVPALEAHCVEFLKKNLRADNAFMLLTQARLFDEPQLASLCLENIDKNTSDAINAEGFTDIDLDTLVAVLERDTLGIREVRLFGAVVRWSEAECQRQQLQVVPENKRKVLGKALALIRFPLMTIEEFAAGPAQSGILTDREVVSLFLHFTVNPKPRVEFIDRPRCCLRGKECSISRFQQVLSEQTDLRRWLWVVRLHTRTHGLPGPRFPLRHQRAAQGDPRIAHQRRQDLLHLLLRGREQQRHFGGGRTDPRDHLLHIVPPRVGARQRPEAPPRSPPPRGCGRPFLPSPHRHPPVAALSVGASPPAGSTEIREELPQVIVVRLLKEVQAPHVAQVCGHLLCGDRGGRWGRGVAVWGRVWGHAERPHLGSSHTAPPPAWLVWCPRSSDTSP